MTDARQKALRRYRKLCALRSSPNKNEAKRATEQAEALAKRHGFTEEDAQEELPVVRRVGGQVSAKDNWRETVAFGVAKRWSCKPLRGGDQVVFEGIKAVDAVVEYRQIVQEIEDAQRRCWQSYDHKYRVTIEDTHRRQFTMAAAEITVQFSGTLGEDHHSLRMSFSDEGRREARAIMKNRVLKKDVP